MNTYIDNSTRKSGETMLLTCALIFGAFGVLAKLLGNTFSPIQLTFLVNLVQFACFSGWVYWKGISLRLAPNTGKSILVFVVLNMLPLFFFINAVQWLGIGAVLLVQNTVTLFTSLTIEYFKSKRISPLQFSFMIISLAALAIIYLPFDINNSIGFLFAFGVGLANALTNVYRQKLSRDYSAEQLSFYSSGFGTFVLGVLNLVFMRPLTGVIAPVGIALFMLYALLHIVTTLLLNKGFARVPLTLGNTILLLEIVAGYGLGALVFGESYGLYQAVGSIILFSAIFGMRVAPSNEKAR